MSVLSGTFSNLALTERAGLSNFNKVVKSYNNSFTMYAETDLDQPTDYSKRYAEGDSDKIKTEVTEYVQDSIKTYCTEGTPYETPLNFSTSTSMSDLRVDVKSTKDIKENCKKASKIVAEPLKIKSEFSSGLMSPEKPVKYCEEGTPGYFSRVPSCGSLNLLTQNEVKTDEVKEVKKEVKRSEAKAVKFEEVVVYAEETPLMFSRSSSLGSLDSIEQHSIHDDRSSIVSDFSRLTSGIISPSELPDSPSQTVPPSPKTRSTLNIFSNLIKFKRKPEVIEMIDQPLNEKSTVFQDDIKKFNVESTPLNFSVTTSLSSISNEELVRDDDKTNDTKNDTLKKDLVADLSENSEDEDILNACINIGIQNNKYNQSSDFSLQKSDVTSDTIKTYCTEGTPAVLSHAGSNSDISLLAKENASKVNEKIVSRKSSFSLLSDDSHESEQALLEKCILAGMPKSSRKDGEKDCCHRNDGSSSDDEDDDDILDNCIKMGIENNSHIKPGLSNRPPLFSNSDSCSNLSILSMQDKDEEYISDINSNFSDEDELLERCVKFGMDAIAKRDKEKLIEPIENTERQLVVKGQELFSDDDSSLSDISNESEQVLLQQCLQAGMPTAQKPFRRNDLTPSEKALLQQCILDGMKKCRTVPKQSEDDSAELSEAEQALLRQCILSGMPKNRNLTLGGPLRQRESAELSESERVLLQECILAGMPKRSAGRKVRDSDEHRCCVHCPRNGSGRVRLSGRERRRRREREAREHVIYNVTKEVSVKKGVFERTRKKWI